MQNLASRGLSCCSAAGHFSGYVPICWTTCHWVLTVSLSDYLESPFITRSPLNHYSVSLKSSVSLTRVNYVYCCLFLSVSFLFLYLSLSFSLCLRALLPATSSSFALDLAKSLRTPIGVEQNGQIRGSAIFSPCPIQYFSPLPLLSPRQIKGDLASRQRAFAKSHAAGK